MFFLLSPSLKSKVVVTSGGGSKCELELDLLYCRLLQASYLDVKVHAHRHTLTDYFISFDTECEIFKADRRGGKSE